MSDYQIPQSGPYSYTMDDGHVFSGVDRQLHSVDDQPAVVYKDGTKWWYDHDLVSRDGDKPAVVFWNGVQEWWLRGRRHRVGSPAVIYGHGQGVDPRARGIVQYWENGKLLREDRCAA